MIEHPPLELPSHGCAKNQKLLRPSRQHGLSRCCRGERDRLKRTKEAVPSAFQLFTLRGSHPKALAAELQSQYVLSFTPEDRTGGYHTLEVRVAGDFRVRVRPGYWSMQPSAQ